VARTSKEQEEKKRSNRPNRVRASLTATAVELATGKMAKGGCKKSDRKKKKQCEALSRQVKTYQQYVSTSLQAQIKEEKIQTQESKKKDVVQ